MTIVRVGTNSRYADGWENVFGGAPSTRGRKKAAGGSGRKPSAAKSAKKSAKKKKKPSKRR